MEQKKNGLQAIYDDFENAAAPYKTEAACALRMREGRGED